MNGPATEEDLKASLDRAFADGIYSTDGFIPKESWATGEAIVLEAGILKQSVSYDQVIDMRFVDQVRKELKRSISGEVSQGRSFYTFQTLMFTFTAAAGSSD
jgi:hypothetical protein